MNGEQREAVTLYEFDKRFSKYSNFRFYDYRDPPPADRGDGYDLILLDPPFLAVECFEKVWSFVCKIRKSPNTKLMACTGRVMEGWLREKGLKRCIFQPEHRRKLENEFGCFTNWDGAGDFAWVQDQAD